MHCHRNSANELAGLESGGGYTPSPYGGIVKYFYPSAEQASGFAANPGNAQFGPFTLTSAEVPNSLITPANTISPLGEGTAITIPNEALPNIPPPTIWNSMPIPGGTP